MASAKPFVRNPYNYDTNAAGDESGLDCKDPSLTKQAFLEETNINTIVERFHITGQLPQNIRMPTFGDFTEITDFHTAMNAIAQANEAFDKMPAAVRARFNNDPGAFVDFCSKEENRAEATKMGLVDPEKAAAAAAALTKPVEPPPPPEPPAKGKDNPPLAKE